MRTATPDRREEADDEQQACGQALPIDRRTPRRRRDRWRDRGCPGRGAGPRHAHHQRPGSGTRDPSPESHLPAVDARRRPRPGRAGHRLPTPPGSIPTAWTTLPSSGGPGKVREAWSRFVPEAPGARRCTSVADSGQLLCRWLRWARILLTVVMLIGVVFTAGELFADLPAWFRPGVALAASVYCGRAGAVRVHRLHGQPNAPREPLRDRPLLTVRPAKVPRWGGDPPTHDRRNRRGASRDLDLPVVGAVVPGVGAGRVLHDYGVAAP